VGAFASMDDLTLVASMIGDPASSTIHAKTAVV
jgi:hypothetical protein